MSLRSETAWSAPRVGRQSSRLDEVLRAGQAHAVSTGGLVGDGSIVGNKAKPFKHHGGHSFGPGYGAKAKVSPGDLGKQLTSCNDEKRRLQKRKDDCEEELARTKAENQRLNEKIARMTMEAASAGQRVQNLAQEKEALRERLMARLAEAGAASGAERVRKEAEIRALLGELRSLDARVAQANQELASSQAELAGQQAVYSQEIQSLEEANTALQAERNQLQAGLEEMRVNLQVLRSTLAEAERALPDGTPADNAVRNAQTQWSDDEMEAFLTNAQEMLDASTQTNAAVEAAQQEYVNITISVDALETENAGVREAYESLQAEVRGLRASIENQIKEGLEKLSKEIKTKQPQAPARRVDADCDRAFGMEQKFNTRLFLAVATARSEDAIRLIHQGATLDTGPGTRYSDSHNAQSTYEKGIDNRAAVYVIFEDMRWVGNKLDDYKHGSAVSPYFQWFESSVHYERRYGMGQARQMLKDDPQRVAAMLQIIDALADNPCVVNAGFKFWLPAHANPTNWTPKLLERAYAKGLMPEETEWSLLNAVLRGMNQSPLLEMANDGFGSKWRKGEHRGARSFPQFLDLPGQEYLDYEKRLMDQTRALIQLAGDLGQKKVNTQARNNAIEFYKARYIDGTPYSLTSSLTKELSPRYWDSIVKSIQHKEHAVPPLMIVTPQARFDEMPRHLLNGLENETYKVLKERLELLKELEAKFGLAGLNPKGDATVYRDM